MIIDNVLKDMSKIYVAGAIVFCGLAGMSNLLNYHFTKKYLMNLPKEATNTFIVETIKSYERGPFLNKLFLYGDYKAASETNSLTTKLK